MQNKPYAQATKAVHIAVMIKMPFNTGAVVKSVLKLNLKLFKGNKGRNVITVQATRSDIVR